MERLVSGLLLLTRLDQEQAMETAPVNLAVVVRDAITDNQAIEPDRVITVESPESVHMLGDEQRLTQVAANLLANVRMHTPPNAAGFVTLREEDERITLDVIDDGPGLGDGQAQKIFERFYRNDGSYSVLAGGAGLGLAIVAAIVGAHKGAVTGANEPDHGARFT